MGCCLIVGDTLVVAILILVECKIIIDISSSSSSQWENCDVVVFLFKGRPTPLLSGRAGHFSQRWPDWKLTKKFT